MMNQPYGEPKLVYEADPSHVDTVKTLKEKLHGVCRKQVMNQVVRVQMMDGQSFEGVVLHIDDDHVYLNLAQDEETTRGLFPPYGPYPPYNPAANAVLPLVLYNLLAITLLYP